MVDDRTAHRAAVEAGYANLTEYIEQWGHEVVEQTQKRYADDVTLQELVRLRVENERLREALQFYADKQNYIEVKNSNVFVPVITVDFKPEVDNGRTARAAFQQKDTE